MQRNGRRIAVMGRYILDYRNNKVREYMSETIRRMVEDYGADYIKFDYNEDCGVGTDYASFCAGEGLEQCASAFYLWVKEMTEKYPSVIFEGCSSGGMRMDYKTLSLFPLVSTSDQVDYLKYPYIAGNILSAVIPEQAAVWSYPVVIGEIGAFIKPEHDTEWAKGAVSLECIAMNMINSFLGRMHLASHLEILSSEQLGLIKDGIAVYNRISEIKKTAFPYLPCGFTKFGDKHVAAGLKTDNKIYLAVWSLGDAELEPMEIKMEMPIKSVRVIYPTTLDSKFDVNEKILKIYFTSENQARFFEIDV
jgi:alpha-galactosidase